MASWSAVAVGDRLLANFHDIRRDEARLRLLRYVAENPEASTREIAKAIGVSNGAAFYLLKALIEKGFLKAKNFAASSKKSQYIYVLTPAGVTARANLTLKFLDRKRREYLALREEISMMENDLETLQPHKVSRSE